MDFDWDDGNRDKNLKHGVHDWEIEEALRDSHQIRDSRREVMQEERFMLFAGARTSGKYLRIVYAIRVKDGRDFIRPISAMPMRRGPRRRYRRRR